MEMELSQVESLEFSSGGILGMLVKWPFDLKRELSHVDSLEFWLNGYLT